jgi:hypothetical protein
VDKARDINFLGRPETARLLGIKPSSLKHYSSSRFKGAKPPMKKIGGKTFYGPVAALIQWFNSDLSNKTIENDSAKAAKQDKPAKVVKIVKAL